MSIFKQVNNVVDEFSPESGFTNFNLILVRKGSPAADNLRYKLEHSINDERLLEAIANEPDSGELTYVFFEDYAGFFESGLSLDSFKKIYGLADQEVIVGKSMIVK